jgi:hypothetical protein
MVGPPSETSPRGVGGLLLVALRRYAVQDLCAKLAVVGTATGLAALGAGSATLTFAAALLDVCVFYAVAWLRERRVRPSATARSRIVGLMLEFGPAELLDLLVRPAAMGAALTRIDEPALAVLAGSLAADVVFYLCALTAWRVREDREDCAKGAPPPLRGEGAGTQPAPAPPATRIPIMNASLLRTSLGASLVLTALLAPSASANEGGLGGAPTWSSTGPGLDFFAVSATTRGGLQSDPLVLQVPSLPADATLEEVFLSWNWLMGGPAPATDTLKLNGVNVVGLLEAQGTPDLGWGKGRGVTFLASGFESALQLGAANILQGAVDKALGSDPAAYGAGLSLIVVYRTTYGVEQRVDLWSGYTSTESSPSGLAEGVLGLPTSWSGGLAHLYLNALDGLDFVGPNDSFLLNGTNVGGMLAGLGGQNDAWQGLAGPGASQNLYDALDDSIEPFMTVGDVDIRVRTDKQLGGAFEDTIGHTLAVFASVEQCGTWTAYCTAKVNSLGCTPVISATGVAGPGGGPFLVRVDQLMNNMNGLLFYGPTANAAPFQGGTLCIGGQITRTGPQNSGGSPSGQDCSGTMSFDFDAYVQSGVDPSLVSGALVFAQYWVRDVNDLFGSSLSDGIVFDLCPLP